MRQCIAAAEVEEQRADFARDFGIDDREHRRPAAATAFAPDGEADATARTNDAAQFAHRLRRIGHVHEAEAAERDVEVGVGEVERLGVHPRERGVADPERIGTALCRVDHRRRNVDTDHPAGGADELGRRERDEAGAAGDVDDALAGTQRDPRQHGGLRRAELRLPEALVGVRRQVPAVALNAPLHARFHVSAGSRRPPGSRSGRRAIRARRG